MPKSISKNRKTKKSASKSRKSVSKSRKSVSKSRKSVGKSSRKMKKSASKSSRKTKKSKSKAVRSYRFGSDDEDDDDKDDDEKNDKDEKDDINEKKTFKMPAKDELIKEIKHFNLPSSIEPLVVNFINKHYDEFIGWRSYFLTLKPPEKNIVRFVFDYIDSLHLEQAMPGYEKTDEQLTAFEKMKRSASEMYNKASLLTTIMGKAMSFGVIMLRSDKEDQEIVPKWIDNLQSSLLKSPLLWSLLLEWIDYYEKVDKSLPKEKQISEMIKWVIRQLWDRDTLFDDLLKENPSLKVDNKTVGRIIDTVRDIWKQRQLLIKFLLTTIATKGTVRDKFIALIEKNIELKARQDAYDKAYEKYLKQSGKCITKAYNIYLKLVDDRKQLALHDEYFKCGFGNKEKQDMCKQKKTKNKKGKMESIEDRGQKVIEKREKRIQKIKEWMKKDEEAYKPVMEAMKKLCELSKDSKCADYSYQSPFSSARYNFEFLELYAKNPYQRYDIQKGNYYNQKEAEKDLPDVKERIAQQEKEAQEKENARVQAINNFKANQKEEAASLLSSLFS